MLRIGNIMFRIGNVLGSLLASKSKRLSLAACL